MAYIKGSIDNPWEFYDILKSFLVECDWTLTSEVESGGDYDQKNMYFTSPEGVRIRVSKYDYQPSSITMSRKMTTLILYAYAINEYSNTDDTQARYVRLSQTHMDYYIMVNDRRVMFALQMYGRSTVAYVGYILPSLSEEIYPYPSFVAGTTATTTTTSTETTFYSFATLASQGYIKRPFPTVDAYSGYEELALTEYTPSLMYATEQYARTSNGKQMLIPVQIAVDSSVNAQDLDGSYGLIDGIYYATKKGANSFDLFEDGDDTYLVVSGGSEVIQATLAVKVE